MKEIEKKLVKTMMLGGGIALGVTLNSTNSMAAELTKDAQPVEEKSTEASQDNKVSVEAMEDAVEVIEGDAVAEEGYAKEANDAVKSGKATKEAAEELLDNAEAVYDQATEKNDAVKEMYDDVVEENEEAKDEFKKSAEEYGLNEYAEKFENASEEDKAAVVDETVEAATEAHDTFVAEHGEDSEEYKAIVDDVNEMQDAANKAAEEDAAAVENLNKVKEQHKEIIEKYEDMKAKVDEFMADMEVLEAQFNEEQAKLDKLNEEYEGFSGSYIVLDESKGDTEGRIYATEQSMHMADFDLEVAKRTLGYFYSDPLPDFFEGDVDEESLKRAQDRVDAAQEAYDKAVEEYNAAVAEMDRLKEEEAKLDKAVADKKTEIDNQTQVVDDLDNEIIGQWVYYTHEGKPVYDVYTEEYEAIKPEIDAATEKANQTSVNLEMAGRNLAEAKATKEEADTAIATEKQNYENVVGASKGFKESQEKKAEADKLVDRAAAAFEKTTNAYNEIKTLYNNEVQKRAEAEKYHKETESKLEAAVKYTLKVNPMARMTLRAFKVDYTDENLLHIAAHRVTTNGSKDEVSQLISTLSVGRFNGNTVNKVIKLLGY